MLCCMQNKLSTLVRPWEISRYSHINLDVADARDAWYWQIMCLPNIADLADPLSPLRPGPSSLFSPPAPSVPTTHYALITAYLHSIPIHLCSWFSNHIRPDQITFKTWNRPVPCDWI